MSTLLVAGSIPALATMTRGTPTGRAGSRLVSVYRHSSSIVLKVRSSSECDCHANVGSTPIGPSQAVNIPGCSLTEKRAGVMNDTQIKRRSLTGVNRHKQNCLTRNSLQPLGREDTPAQHFSNTEVYMGLVLTRKLNESVVIGDTIKVQVCG